jgi:hypothetical protein
MKALTWLGKNDIRCDSVPDLLEDGRNSTRPFVPKNGCIKIVMKPS